MTIIAMKIDNNFHLMTSSLISILYGRVKTFLLVKLNLVVMNRKKAQFFL